MSFWGVEVKPGKPFTHSFDTVRGRLRISQATLAIGSSTKKSLVQCNVGDKSPVLLCCLLPDKTESCQLDLEFEEADEVVFSVIGPRGVHLTGYYVGNSRRSNLNSDSESFGEDIANTDTEERSHSSNEEEYEDSFINDGEPEVLSPSPISSDGDDEEVVRIMKPRNRKVSHQRLKKKYQTVESDDDTGSPQQNIENSFRIFPESEGEDNFPISSILKNRTDTKKTVLKAAEEKADEDIVKTDDKTKGEVKALVNEPQSGKNDLPCNSLLPSDEVGPERRTKPKKKRKDLSKERITTGKQQQDDSMANGTDLLVNNEQDRGSDLPYDSFLPSAELGPENGMKPKKKRKKHSTEEKVVEADCGNNINGLKENKAQQPEANADNMGQDLLVRNKHDQKQTDNMIFDIDPDRFADGSKFEKKTKKKQKKKSKTLDNEENVNIDVPFSSKQENNRSFKDFEDKSVNARSTQLRTLSNGLIIEEIASGKSDGKIAAPGKKVKVHYSGKLKENGKLIDSNIGKAPFKFRLGAEEIIDGWNIGVDGMRVGEKRRLTIPPSLGYGSQGTGENVPPNSWLVYDIELIGVH